MKVQVASQSEIFPVLIPGARGPYSPGTSSGLVVGENKDRNARASVTRGGFPVCLST